MAEKKRPRIISKIVLGIALIGILLSFVVLVDGILSISEQKIEQPYVRATSAEESILTPQPTSTQLDIEVPDPYSGGS